MTITKQSVAIVNGASGGIGAAVAERPAKDGFTVVVNYAGNAPRAAAVVEGDRSAGGRAGAVQGESRSRAVARMSTRLENELGGRRRC